MSTDYIWSKARTNYIATNYGCKSAYIYALHKLLGQKKFDFKETDNDVDTHVSLILWKAIRRVPAIRNEKIST